MKDGKYVVTLDDYESVGTHWIALYINGDYVTYFDSFGVENIPNNNIIANICRMQA